MEKRLLQEMKFMMERLESPRMTDTELSKRRERMINEIDRIETRDAITPTSYREFCKYSMNTKWCDVRNGEEVFNRLGGEEGKIEIHGSRYSKYVKIGDKIFDADTPITNWVM